MTAERISTWIGIATAFVLIGAAWGALSSKIEALTIGAQNQQAELNGIKDDNRLAEQVQKLEVAIAEMRVELGEARKELTQLGRRNHGR